MLVPHHDLNIKIIYFQLKTRQLVWYLDSFITVFWQYKSQTTLLHVRSEIRVHITADSSVEEPH